MPRDSLAKSWRYGTDHETARGSAKGGSIRKYSSEWVRGKLCPLRGCKGSPPEGLNERGNVNNSGDKWERLEAVVRRVIREELDARLHETERQLSLLSHKPKVEFINGQWTGITPEQLSSWKLAYSCDVDQELKKAAAWLTSNKQPKNHGRFLNAWLSKSSERSLIRSIPTRNEIPAKQKCAYCDKPATGAPNRTPSCDLHFQAAMDHEPVKAA